MAGEAAVPACFYDYIEEDDRYFLFLGYSLRDWNLRVVLHSLQLERTQAAGLGWAIQKDPSALERALWGARGVHIYDVPLDSFVEQLGAY